MGTLSKPVTNKRIILNLFVDSSNKPVNPILIYTKEQNMDNIPDKYNFYKIYKKRIDEINHPSIQVKSNTVIHGEIQDLVRDGELISMKALLDKTPKYANKYGEYNGILKSFKPVFDPMTHKFIKDGKKPVGLTRRPRNKIYILKSQDDQKALGYLLEEIKKIRADNIPEIEKKLVEIDVEEEIEGLTEVKVWSKDLERFDNQMLKSDDFSLMELYNDIVDFLGENFYRRCPNDECGHNILEPNNDYMTSDISKKPIINQEAYETLKHGMGLYLTSLEDAKKETFPYPVQTKADFVDALKQIKKQYFLCPECKKKGIETTILKTSLYFVEDAVFQFLIGIDANKSSILYGYPDAREDLSCGA